MLPEVEKRNSERFGSSGIGLDLANLEQTTEEEKLEHLRYVYETSRTHGIPYWLTAAELSIRSADFGKDCAKQHCWRRRGA